ncbi:MAG: CDP-alcohol phosphatidyltransferase family protein [Verrucomicrobia subdivision 3 bacterium]|nr:CDP-alcohol phosphatidyltransferase family protein [Limisphaerales bacterium]
MTTANKVTIGRIILVPFFVVQMLYYFRTGEELHRYFAMVAFLVATISDGIDGYLARHHGQATQLGSYLDPLADKLLMFSGLILMTMEFEGDRFGQRIPLWLTGTVIGRDLIVVTGSALLYAAIGNVTVKPLFLSKAASVLQMVTIGWVLCKFSPIGTFWLAVAAVFCTTVTGLLYVRDGIRQFSEHPIAHPPDDETETGGTNNSDKDA